MDEQCPETASKATWYCDSELVLNVYRIRSGQGTNHRTDKRRSSRIGSCAGIGPRFHCGDLGVQKMFHFSDKNAAPRGLLPMLFEVLFFSYRKSKFDVAYFLGSAGSPSDNRIPAVASWNG